MKRPDVEELERRLEAGDLDAATPIPPPEPQRPSLLALAHWIAGQGQAGALAGSATARGRPLSSTQTKAPLSPGPTEPTGASRLL